MPERPRVVVTGSGGYLGSRIARGLSEVAEVIGTVRPGAGCGGREREAGLGGGAGLTQLLRDVRPDHVIHAAGRVAGDRESLFRDNVETTRFLAESLLAAAPTAILTVIGSAAEYGRPHGGERLAETRACEPISDYGRAKLAASRLALDLRAHRGLRLNILRPFNLLDAPLSPAQVLGAFVARASALRNTPAPRVVPMGPLGIIRDFVAVADLVRLLGRLVSGEREGLVINVCSGRGRSVRDLVAYLNALSDDRYLVQEAGGGEPADAVIGDPGHFREAVGADAALPIEPILAEAWRLSGA